MSIVKDMENKANAVSKVVVAYEFIRRLLETNGVGPSVSIATALVQLGIESFVLNNISRSEIANTLRTAADNLENNTPIYTWSADEQ